MTAAPSDFAADNYSARHDGTEDPDLHDAGEHPALVDLTPLTDAVRDFLYGPTQEMARLEHARIVAAVLHLRRQPEFGTESWWDAYRALMDVAARIEGAA